MGLDLLGLFGPAQLVFEEAESAALRAWLKERTSTVRLASDLARVEVHRSTLRRDSAALPRAVTALSGVHLIPMGERVVTESLGIGDAVLRSLDAIHLASASVVKPRLTAFVAYDKRLFNAAEAEGMPAVAPGT